ncbi:hypothetical protein [Kurthia sp. Dielmo]|uniref:hypothetical protein n=1 Tax=Kurthia sp. Dielmo TaxID=1033738 RepID=UPI001121D405|nr:hypothetical protein [Kurthia sp. Dielmo]
MLDKKQLYENAIMHFPRRSDIRKRKTSNGAKLLRSILEEADDFNQAIEELRASFFAINYKGKADELLLNLSMFPVGSVADDIQMDGFTQALDENHFMNDAQTFIVEDGFCYLHRQNTLFVSYRANGDTYTAQLKDMTYWNIIDEFAMISSIDRFDNESNEELLNRVFLSYRNVTNSSAIGLKNAIINAVSNHVEIIPDDIVIEPMNEQNLHTYFDEIELIENLSFINKDVLRQKVWGRSKWEHPFAGIENVPSEWDVVMPAVQDGVGDIRATYAKDISDSLFKRAVVNTYNKSEAMISNYMLSNNIDVDINLGLTKLSNRLNSKKVSYKVSAEKVTDVSNDVIRLNNEYSGRSVGHLQDIVANLTDYRANITSNNLLEAGHDYRVTVEAEGDYDALKVEQLELLNSDGSKRSYLQPNAGFKKDSDGNYIPDNILKRINSTEDMYNVQNFVTTLDGIELEDTANKGHAEISIEGASNKYLIIKESCQMVSFTGNNALLKAEGFTLTNGMLTSRNESDRITIEMTCRNMQFAVSSGRINYDLYVNGENVASESNITTDDVKYSFDKPTKIKMVIRPVGTQSTILSNFMYNNYELSMSVDGASLYHNNTFGHIIYEADPGAKLILDMSCKTGFSPVIEYIHIGGIVKGKKYVVSNIIPKEDSLLLLKADGAITVEDLTDGRVIGHESDMVLALRNNGATPMNVKLNIANYTDFSIENYTINRIFTAGVENYYLSLQPGASISSFITNGTYKKSVYEKTIKDVLNTQNVYVSSYQNGFFDGISGHEVKLVRDMFSDAPTFNSCEIISKSNVRYNFMATANSSISVETTYFKQDFVQIGCVAIAGEQHICYNTQRVLSSITENIQVARLFYPELEASQLYCFYIETSTSGAKVTFMDTNIGTSYIGEYVKIELDNFASDESNYIKESVVVRRNAVLSNVMYLDRTFVKEGKEIDLAEYMISPPQGLEVVYANGTEQASESFYAEQDGFNKLKKSNIESIDYIMVNGSKVSSALYTLLNKEGIICWNDESLYGKTIDIRYRFKVPMSLRVLSLDYLYEKVGYKVDTLEHTGTFVFDNVGTYVELSDSEYSSISEADSYTIEVNNENYRATIIGKMLIFQLINDDDAILVNSGYYYRGGNEYYHFAQPFEADTTGANGIKIENGMKYAGQLKLSQESENFMPNSSMFLNKIETVSHIDFVNEYNVNETSGAKTYTACDHAAFWNTYNMSTGLVDSYNGYGLNFTSNDEAGYAMLQLNKLFLEKRGVVSLYASQQPFIAVGYQNANGDNLNDSFAPVKKVPMIEHTKNLWELDVTTYLVKGQSIFLYINQAMTVDDIVTGVNITEDMHTTNVERYGIGFSFRRSKDEVITIPLAQEDLLYKGCEFYKGAIRQESSLNWGYTNIKKFAENWNDVSYTGMELYKQNAIVNRTNSGTFETKAATIPRLKYVSELLIYVEELKNNPDIEISVLTSKTSNGTYRTVNVSKIGNGVIVLEAGALDAYVKIAATIVGEAHIKAIDIYVAYNSYDGNMSLTYNTNSNFTTKIYDLGSVVDFKVKNELTAEDARLYVRGIRMDGRNFVPTKWYDIAEEHEFVQYKFLQFKLMLETEDAYAKINNFTVEVQ